jgi:hypothetical protein
VTTKFVITSAAAIVCTGSLFAAQSQPSDTPITTFVGCLYREADLPSRSANVAEHAGVSENYILVAARDTAAPTGTSGATGATNAVAAGSDSHGVGPTDSGSSAAGRMYKVERIAGDQLQPLVGKRVEVTGQIDRDAADPPADAGSAQPEGAKSDPMALANLEATSIREVEGPGPTTPMQP